ncbi:MAG: potassium-transporting ATPase subunit KdpC [Bacteroidota bacterium]
MFLKNLLTAIIITVLLTALTGLVYPLIVTGIAQVVFPQQANGSLIKKSGKIIGSELIGQPFSDAKYFWSRQSATSPFPYNAASSYATNYGPLNPALFDEVTKRIHDLKAVDSTNTQPLPVDLVTSSASGLDPHISIASALYQLPRVARSRGMNEQSVRAMIDRFTQGRTFGLLGEPRVNVLKLNLALDGIESN